MTVKPVTAADVRAYFQADEKRMARLSPEARKTVEKGARGLLHPKAVALHNSRRRTSQYTPGNSKARAEAQREQRAVLVARGLAGARGPLSKVALASMSKV